MPAQPQQGAACVCVWAAEGLVAREILTYRAPLPAALSLASTSQRKRFAAAGLIYNLSLLFPPASVSPPRSRSRHCLSFPASKLEDFLLVISTSHCTNHNNFLSVPVQLNNSFHPSFFSFHSSFLHTSPLLPHFTLPLR